MTDEGRAQRDLYVSLRDHFDSRLEALEKLFLAGMAAAERAVEVFEKSAEKWRADSNEWRGAMNDREERFATKVQLEGLSKSIDEVKGRVDRAEGRTTGLNAAWGIIVLVAMIVLAALQIYLKT